MFGQTTPAFAIRMRFGMFSGVPIVSLLRTPPAKATRMTLLVLRPLPLSAHARAPSLRRLGRKDVAAAAAAEVFRKSRRFMDMAASSMKGSLVSRVASGQRPAPHFVQFLSLTPVDPFCA
jgi:hypothetical protein